jgi:spermidine/putrescine transport system substrate-binding protein
MSLPRSLAGPISRRHFLQLGGVAGAAAFLAACGSSSTTPTAGPTNVPSAATPPSPGTSTGPATPEPVTGGFKMASWIGYIDIADDTSYPSLDRFTEETGVVIDYRDGAVNGNDEFFASDLRGNLEAGVPTGWDICVLTDWMVQRLIYLEWLETVDTSTMTNYPVNLEDRYTGRPWDPDNTLAIPWQSGMTGLGYDQAVTGPLERLDVLFDDRFGGRISYLLDLRDTVGLSALSLGIDPATITAAQFDQALAVVQEAIDSGIVRRVTGNDYVQDMVNGDVVLAVAWSGDVLTLLVPGQKQDQDFQWTLATEGGMLWTDNMVIPLGAENKRQAEVFIDWYYVPANAAQIEAKVNYVCPVKGAAEAIKTIDPSLADNPLIFPTPEMAERLVEFRSLDLEEAAAWEAAYDKAVGL